MYILKDGNLKFNRMDMLNDVQESDFFKNDEIAKLVFVSCFSYADESIPMWHMYSSKNEGVRIGFKVSDRSFKEIFDKSKPVSTDSDASLTFALDNNFAGEVTDENWIVDITHKDIVYNEDLANQPEFINTGFVYDMNNMALVKARDWSYEKESRLVAILRTTKGDLEDQNTWIEVPDYKFLLIPIELNSFSSIEIMFSPWMTTGIKELIKIMVKEYIPDINVEFKESKFYGKLR